MIHKMKWLKPGELEPEVLQQILAQVPKAVAELSKANLNGDYIQWPYFIDCIYTLVFTVPGLELERIEWPESGETLYKKIKETV